MRAIHSNIMSFSFLLLVLLIHHANTIGAIPFSATTPTFGRNNAGLPYLNASSLNITSIEPNDLDTYFNQALTSGWITIDLNNNHLSRLPTNLLNQTIYLTMDLSQNLFTGESISNFFLNGAGRITLDLSYNQIGPVPPTVLQFMNIDMFICQYCGFTSLPSASFTGSQIHQLDLSYNDFSAPGSIAPQAFGGLTIGTIILNNCKLRTLSLPQSGLFDQINDPFPFLNPDPHTVGSFFFNMANHNQPDFEPDIQPPPVTVFDTFTATAYLATWPNIFVDLNDGLFIIPDDWNENLGIVIQLGDFVNYVGGAEGLFGGSTSAEVITVYLAPNVVVDAIEVTLPYYCPLQQLARALTNCQHRGLEYRISAYGLNSSAESVPDIPECTFPVITPTCFGLADRLIVSTEPALLQRPFYKWANSMLGSGYFHVGLQWVPPTANIWNRALNRSDWMPTDMLCDLTNVPNLVLPALPYPQFLFPPPENMLACLTSTVYYIDWTSANLVTAGLFGGRRSNAPQINVAVDLLMLYAGDRPVPLDFFTSLVGHLQGLLNVVEVWPPSILLEPCMYGNCTFSRGWLDSHCPYIVNQTCFPCPTGYYPGSISSYEYGTVYYCASTPAGSYLQPYADASQFLLPISCQPGSYQQYQRQTSCTLCSPGTYNSLEGSAKPSDCLQCPPGTANPNSGGSNLTADCEPCPIGTASLSPGVAACAPCALGYYQNETGQFQCQPCPINTYRDLTGGTSTDDCTPCPSQTPLSSPGTTSIFSCSTGATCSHGYYTQMSDPKPCLSLCPKGSYCLDGQAKLCPSGSFTNMTGMSSCIPCGAGYYSSVEGISSSTDCRPCPVSTYSTNAVSSSCHPCPSGTISAVFGSSSNVTCVTDSDCSSPNNLCQPGSVIPILLSTLLPLDGLTFFQTFNGQVKQELQAVNTSGASALTPDTITILYRPYLPYRNTSSLRLHAFQTDAVLESHDATQSITDQNHLVAGTTNSILPSSAAIALIIILLTIAFVSWPIYRFIPPQIAFHFDQFNMSHHVNAGHSSVKQPTQFGSAVTWTFLWIMVLVIIFLATASNTIITTSLVPPSSIPYSGTARGDIQLTIRAYSSIDSVTNYCMDSQIITGQSGFSSSFVARKRTDSQICTIAADCLSCGLRGGSSSVSFTFPYDTQFFEWELFISSAAPKTWSRRYGILSQLPGQLVDAASQLQFSAIESYFTDHTHSGDGQVKSGFEFDFIQYQSIQPQSLATYNPDSTVIITFMLAKSDVMFDSSASNKLSSFQLVVAILTAIVSLFSIFGMLFNKVERFGLNQLCHLTSGQLNKNDQGEIGVSSQPTHLIGLSHTVNKVDSDSDASTTNQSEFHPNLDSSSGSVPSSTEMANL